MLRKIQEKKARRLAGSGGVAANTTATANANANVNVNTRGTKPRPPSSSSPPPPSSSVRRGSSSLKRLLDTVSSKSESDGSDAKRSKKSESSAEPTFSRGHPSAQSFSISGLGRLSKKAEKSVTPSGAKRQESTAAVMASSAKPASTESRRGILDVSSKLSKKRQLPTLDEVKDSIRQAEARGACADIVHQTAPPVAKRHKRDKPHYVARAGVRARPEHDVALLRPIVAATTVRENGLRSACFLHGPHGSGKETIARFLAYKGRLRFVMLGERMHASSGNDKSNDKSSDKSGDKSGRAARETGEKRVSSGTRAQMSAMLDELREYAELDTATNSLLLFMRIEGFQHSRDFLTRIYNMPTRHAIVCTWNAWVPESVYQGMVVKEVGPLPIHVMRAIASRVYDELGTRLGRRLTPAEIESFDGNGNALRAHAQFACLVTRHDVPDEKTKTTDAPSMECPIADRLMAKLVARDKKRAEADAGSSVSRYEEEESGYVREDENGYSYACRVLNCQEVSSGSSSSLNRLWFATETSDNLDFMSKAVSAGGALPCSLSEFVSLGYDAKSEREAGAYRDPRFPPKTGTGELKWRPKLYQPTTGKDKYKRPVPDKFGGRTEYRWVEGAVASKLRELRKVRFGFAWFELPSGQKKQSTVRERSAKAASSASVQPLIPNGCGFRSVRDTLMTLIVPDSMSHGRFFIGQGIVEYMLRHLFAKGVLNEEDIMAFARKYREQFDQIK